MGNPYLRGRRHKMLPSRMPAPEPKPLVFLSHSVGGDQAASDLLDELTKGLEALGWDPYVDRERLQPSTIWRQQLHTALGACDAAVILFSEKAYADTQWVLKEATIFRWRHSLDPDFRLVPVLFPKVSRLALSENNYKPLMLGEFVPVELPQADIVKAVVKALGPKRVGLSPIERIQRAIAERLKHIDAGALKLAAQQLGTTLPWRVQLAPHEQLARDLFHADLPLVTRALEEIADDLGADRVRQILKHLEPFTVEPTAVEPIPKIARLGVNPPDLRPVLAINTSEESTGERYIQRARCHTLHWRVVKLANAGGGDTTGSLAGELLNEIRTRYHQGKTDQQIRTLLAAAQQSGNPLFVLVHGPVDAFTADELRSEFPHCVFLVLAADTPKQELKDNNITLLDPPIDPLQEEQTIIQIELARQIALQLENG